MMNEKIIKIEKSRPVRQNGEEILWEDRSQSAYLTQE